MQFTTIKDFFNPSDPFAYPIEWLPAMEAGFTREQAAANDPAILGEFWRCAWPEPSPLVSPSAAASGGPTSGGSAPVATPSYNMGWQNTPVGEAGGKSLRHTGGEFQARVPVAEGGLFIDCGLRHGCPPPPPAVPPAVSAVPAARLLPVADGAVVPPAGPVSGLVVDWLNFTYPNGNDATVETLKRLLGDDWQDMEKGLYGYLTGARCGHVTLLWNGSVDGMGVHVQVSGQGCREIEGRCSAAHAALLDWRGWLADRVKEGAIFGQTHLAFDDLDGRISIEQITTAFKAGETVTRFNKFAPIEEYGQDGKLTAHGFNFGRRSADTSITCYDKRLEQLQKASTVDVEGYAEKLAALEQGWTRVEMRNRNKRSHALVLRVVEEGFSVAASVLRGYLDVRIVAGDGETNKMRWLPAAWWAEFCSWAERTRLKVEGVVKSFQSSMVWLDRQVGTVLAMVNTVMPEPMQFIEQVMERGAKRFNRRHLNLMSSYLLAGQTALPGRFFGSDLPVVPTVWQVTRERR